MRIFINCCCHIYQSTSRGALSNEINVSHLDRTQEEADTILIIHALEAAKRENEVYMMSPDIDVFTIALAAGNITLHTVTHMTET